MLNIVKREEPRHLGYDDINRFSCPNLQRIDKLWVSNSDKRFGFSVQKEIWISTKSRLGIKLSDLTDKDYENYLRFARAVGRYDDKLEDSTSRSRGGFVSYAEYVKRIKENPEVGRGGVPYYYSYSYIDTLRKLETWQPKVLGSLVAGDFRGLWGSLEEQVLSRVATCRL